MRDTPLVCTKPIQGDPRCASQYASMGKMLAHYRYVHGKNPKPYIPAPQPAPNTQQVRPMQPQQVPQAPPQDAQSQIPTMDDVKAYIDAMIKQQIDEAVSAANQERAQVQPAPQILGVPPPPPKAPESIWEMIAKKGMDLFEQNMKQRATRQLIELQSKAAPSIVADPFSQLGRDTFNLYMAQIANATGKATGQVIGKGGIPAMLPSSTDAAISKFMENQAAAQAAADAVRTAEIARLKAIVEGTADVAASASEHTLAMS